MHSKQAPASPVQAIQRGALFLLTLSGFVAFIEPSPFEGMFAIVLVVFLLTGGLTLHVMFLPLMACLFAFNLGGFISLAPFLDEAPSVTFVGTSTYLSIACVTFAMMMREDAEGRLKALRDGYVLAAVAASVAGILGYFNIAGLGESLSHYDRAAGTFKDPNVLGTFVILPLVYLVRSMLVDKVKPAGGVAAGVILFGGVFLSFSRGAWACAIASLAMMTILTYVTCDSAGIRRRIVLMTLGGIAFLTVTLVFALSFDTISDMFNDRATLSKDYDLGSQGRFGRHLTSIPMLLDRVNGFGPLRFHVFFPEDPHDVFINGFSSYGWLGGFAYLFLIMLTIALGWRAVRTPFALRDHAIVVWSVLFIEILQGFQIDTDHWRHFWLMMGLMWGMVPAARTVWQDVRLPARRAQPGLAMDTQSPV